MYRQPLPVLNLPSAHLRGMTTLVVTDQVDREPARLYSEADDRRVALMTTVVHVAVRAEADDAGRPYLWRLPSDVLQYPAQLQRVHPRRRSSEIPARRLSTDSPRRTHCRDLRHASS